MRHSTPRKWLRRLGVALALAAVMAGLVYGFLPGAVERALNRVSATTRRPPSARAVALHRTLRVADLHADSLLWNRDLLERGARGHVDLPRLVAGNVAFQAFTIPTKFPLGANNERTDGNRFDLITALAVAQRWPAATWTSLTQRTLHQCRKLQDAAARSGGKLVLITTANDLKRFLERRAQEPTLTAGMLGVEGAHALDGKLENVDALFDAGVRMMAPTHFFDNDLGGSAHGVEKGGLTDFGRSVIRRMEERGMILDLAHASPKVIDEALAAATRPVVISHTGVRGACGGLRNVTDEQIRGVAKTGGVIAIGYFFAAVCGYDARMIARSIRYTANVAGVEHVALGSDYDGAVGVPFDAAHLDEITDALLDEGFSEEEIRLIMGENALRVFERALP
jgi:microsomal dipeptidase-like Zn-dependent dipeptidase